MVDETPPQAKSMSSEPITLSCISGAARIVEWTRPLRLPGDRTIGTLVANQRLTAYAVTPPLFEQNRKDIRSTVGRTVGNRETKECASEWW